MAADRAQGGNGATGPGRNGARPRFGGIGAVFFLVTLGGIAWYVQQQEIPEDRELLRRPATAMPELVEEEAPPSLPWQDRLDLGAIKPLPLHPTQVGTTDGDTEGAPAEEPTEAVDLADARYVQDLSDGHRLLFTLDPVLQDSALQIFRNREVPYGAAVIIDLKDNSVLTFAGHSSMDSQVDPLEILTTAWAPAASTFKLITATSLIEHGEATPSSKECFSGGLQGITDDLLSDEPARDSRCATLSEAIAQSHNVVIGKLALKHLDERELTETAQLFQFEQKIPFEFPVEPSPAHIPTEPKERAKVAAGFWHVDQSPLHAAVIASIFARGGVFQPPHIVGQVVGPDGADLTPQPPKARRVISREAAEAVALMMVDTTTVGTAKKSFIDPNGQPYIVGVDVAAKTGSLTGKRPPNLNYNWLIGFAPAEDPEIAFAVVLANEPKWRIKAHYAARRMIQIYLERREAIARHRDARLALDGLSLPQRDPQTGAIVKAEAEPEPAEPAALPGVGEALPPVPGAVAPPDPAAG